MAFDPTSPRKMVHGIGINDADYYVQVRINGKKTWCPFYITWKNLLDRVYSPKRIKQHASYEGCSICEDWLTFSKFKAWMETQNWEGMNLDKDLIKPGNRHYSPETCCFVPHSVNQLTITNNDRRGKFPIGVYYDKARGLFAASCNNGIRSAFLGRYATPEEAHAAYVKYKTALIHAVANKQRDSRIAEGLRLHADLLRHAPQ